ncbi:hypothetical protein X777_06771 [Ooceraea biroi]|uniref:Uncharacterized protein n=1 Tax=Ooceraea biroi TaxID=2015173 RepID=A0A026WF80_OOCBI|nr:hypothetical protein X777_06771 [Ooceraea biroi]
MSVESGIARLICPITLNNPRDNSIGGRKGPSTREGITRRQSVIPLVRTSPPHTHVLKRRKMRVSWPKRSSRKMHQQALTACGVNSPSGDLGLPPKPLTGGPYTGFSFLFFKSKDACRR